MSRRPSCYGSRPGPVEYAENCCEYCPVENLYHDARQYVLGFAHSIHGEVVLLIEKNRPDWMKGKLNGIGGKIEPGETPEDAMYREFREETGLEVGEWIRAGELFGPWGKVYVFKNALIYGVLRQARSTTDEVVDLISTSSLQSLARVGKVMKNVPALLQLCLLTDAVKFTIEEGKE